MYMDMPQAPAVSKFSDYATAQLQQANQQYGNAGCAPPSPPTVVEFIDQILNRLSEQRAMVSRLETLFFGPSPESGAKPTAQQGAMGALELIDNAIAENNARLDVISRRMGGR